jgi:arylsulfatase A-like enzyme
LANAPVDAARPLDGVNLVPYLTGQKPGAPHDTIYLRMHDKGAFAVRSGDYKLVIPAKGSDAQLYNLAQDIGESKNLAGVEPSVLKELEAKRDAWNRQLVEPVFEGLMTPKGQKAAPAAD